MTRPRKPSFRRGLTLMELLLALSISAMVAGTIVAMLSAVRQGVVSRRDSRNVLVMAHAAETRLTAYLVPANCILEATSTSLVIWLNDDTKSDTVHATELRWMRYDAAAGEIVVDYVSFPEDWSEAMCDVNNRDYPKASNWETVKQSYATRDLIRSITIVDQLGDLEIVIDAAPMSARQASFDLTYELGDTTEELQLSATIRFHHVPKS